MPKICDEKNVDMLTSQGIFTKSEIRSRCDIILENYVKTVNIEAMTMINITRKEILPAIMKFSADIANGISLKSSVSGAACKYEKSLVLILSELIDKIDREAIELENTIKKLKEISEIIPASEFVRDTMLSKMKELRSSVDRAETMTSKEYWPMPTYDQLLFGI